MTTSVLFVCKDNASLSLMGEALLNHQGKGEFEAESAGMRPGQVNPFAAAVLAEKHIDPENLRTKPVSEFKGRTFDYIIMLGDGDERPELELLPARMGNYYWTFSDPAETPGSTLDVILAFRRTVLELSMRLSLLMIIVERLTSSRERLMAA